MNAKISVRVFPACLRGTGSNLAVLLSDRYGEMFVRCRSAADQIAANNHNSGGNSGATGTHAGLLGVK